MLTIPVFNFQNKKLKNLLVYCKKNPEKGAMPILRMLF
jgi:hypothetical protein